MNESVDIATIEKFQSQLDDDVSFRVARNAATRTEVSEVAMNWDKFVENLDTFSHVITDEMKASNQRKSGRCWIFAATNVLRIHLGRKYHLEQFEFSQSYLFFWDKFEKSNYFLENIIETAKEDIGSRIVNFLLAAPVNDGGQWSMFCNLVHKYGLVPQSAMPDSHYAKNSQHMNKILTYKLREFAHELRMLVSKGTSRENLVKRKNEMLANIYRILCIHLGSPPRSFNWEFKDKKKKFHRHSNLTPLQFYQKFLGVDLNDYCTIVNTEMQPHNTHLTVQYLGNVYEGKNVAYINLSPDELRKYTIDALKHNMPVWFGADVGKRFHREIGTMGMGLYDYELFYGTEFTMDKRQRMESLESCMTHAMAFTGVDLVDDKPTKWRVENSWGDASAHKGYLVMQDDWFDEYVFEVAIEKKRLPKHILDLLDKDPIVLPPWDPMGAVAN